MLGFMALRKLGLLAALLGAGVFASGCNWTWLWQQSGSSLPGALGLGYNDQAYVSLDGIYVDVTIAPPESKQLETVASGCINQTTQPFDNCVVGIVDPNVGSGPFAAYEQAAVRDANCGVPGCEYGVSLYYAAVGYAFGRGSNPPPGCFGFKLNILNGISYVPNSWYYKSENIAGGAGDAPANAFCETG